MARNGEAEPWSHLDIALASAGALFYITLGSAAVLFLTSLRCDTNPQDDPGWQFSTYCRALHSARLFHYPDNVSGGGVLNAIFLVPLAITVTGVIVANQACNIVWLKRAVYASFAALVALLIFLFAFANSTCPYCSGP